MEYTVIGDTVNTAQRAESVAKRHQLVVTDVMYSKIEKYVTAVALEPIKVKGKAELQNWWSVTGFATENSGIQSKVS
jgi:class 3 adenylate cyclase